MCGQSVPMKSWAEDDKPREKLLQKGVAALSTNELLAILLRSGKVGESVLSISRRILADCGNELNNLARLSIHELIKKYDGIGVAKAAAIVVAMEMGRRRMQEEVLQSAIISSSRQAYNFFSPLLKDLEHEEFWVVFLSRANRILGNECLSSGGMTSTITDLRMLFRRALEMKACALIVAHNHPSTLASPSPHDQVITEKIRSAGEFLDITLHDHLIIAGDNYYSFADEGTLRIRESVKIKEWLSD